MNILELTSQEYKEELQRLHNNVIYFTKKKWARIPDCYGIKQEKQEEVPSQLLKHKKRLTGVHNKYKAKIKKGNDGRL
jgi:hypothetical protein